MTLRSITIEQIDELGVNDTTELRSLFSAMPSTLAIDLESMIQQTPLTLEEIIKLSIAFVDERNQVLGKLVPHTDVAHVFIVVLPTKHPWPRSIPISEGYAVFIPLGFVELMRHHAMASVWAGRLSSPGPLTERARPVVRFLNLRSVLFATGLMPLPELEKAVSREIRDAGYRVAEAAMLFGTMHEVGHHVYDQLADRERRGVARAFNVNRDPPYSPAQIIELYADRYAVDAVPDGAGTALVHASMLFFTLQNFIESLGWPTSGTHPATEDRVIELVRHLSPSISDDNELLSVTRQQLKQMHEVSLTPASMNVEDKLDALVEIARVTDSDPWEAVVSDVCRLPD